MVLFSLAPVRRCLKKLAEARPRQSAPVSADPSKAEAMLVPECCNLLCKERCHQERRTMAQLARRVLSCYYL